MRRIVAIACAWIASFGGPASGADAVAPAEAIGDAHDLLFLGVSQPILVRFHVQVGERPLGAAWLDAIGRLHAYLDFNGDGTVSREEAERASTGPGSPDSSAAPGRPAWPWPWPGAWPTVRLGADAARARRPPAGWRGLGRRAGPVRPDDPRPVLGAVRRTSDSDKDTTFARLDTNGDGALGPEERERAARVLQRSDRNDDESVSAGELSTFRNPYFGNSDPQQEGADAVTPVLMLDRGVSRIPDRAAGAGPLRPRRPRRREGRGPSAGPLRDRPGGRGLPRVRQRRRRDARRRRADAVPRTRQARRRGDRPARPAPLKRSVVEFLVMQLGAAGKPGLGSLLKPYALDVVDRPGRGPTLAAVQIRRGDDEMATIEVGNVRVELRIGNTSDNLAHSLDIYKNLFQNVDADRNQAISLAEVQGQEPFDGLFRLMDRNGDGQVTEGELDDALAMLDALSRGHAVLAVADRGLPLFGNLDTSGDGRIGLRELRVASERLASFDRDGDGQVKTDEIPHRFEWTLTQATIPLGDADPGIRYVRVSGGRRCRRERPPGSSRWTATATATSPPASSSALARSSSAATPTATG